MTPTRRRADAQSRRGSSATLRVGAAAGLRLCASARLGLTSVLLLGACTRGTDHERIGDRRYAEHSWADAVAEYRLAARQHAPSLELRAKLGAAALHAGMLVEAAAAWRNLGIADASARDEAAEGLVRTARLAIGARDIAALRAAAGALQKLAPGRLPELGVSLAMALEPRHDGDADLLLVAAAGASGAASDSLVAVWAEATARAAHCDAAAGAFGALIRRNATTALTRLARGGLAGCRVDAGRALLAAGNLEEAEASFRAAIALGVPDSTVRLAWVLVGDARWAGGDSAVAAESYRKALNGADEDSPIALRAREQLLRLTGGTPTP